MNSITSSNIWFAIDIDCGSTETLANMYLNNGHIRFTTDNYDPVVTSATYEDTTPVSGVWYKDALKLDGLDDTLINIDLAYGTGYSTLNGWSFSIINKCVNGSPFHKAILDTTSTYLLGSNITFYVVIDNVFYKRWVGIVSDYAITEDYFKINCDDKFIKNFNLFPKTTVGATNYPYALTDSVGKIIPVCLGDVKYAKPLNVENQELNFKLGTSFPLVRIKPDIATGSGSSLRGFSVDAVNYSTDTVDQFLASCDVSMGGWGTHNNHSLTQYTIINNTKSCICITVAIGYDITKFLGKYVSYSDNTNDAVSTDSKNYKKIIDVKGGSSSHLQGLNTKLVYLIIDGIPDDITDYTQFYGNIAPNSIANVEDVTDDNLYVYIWELTNNFKISENDVTIVNSFIDNPKVISDQGSITCYRKNSDDTISKFNPLTITKIDNHTLAMMDGTSEVYHIPETAKWFEYNAATDPINIETLGNSDCSKVLDPTITWDDDQLSDKYMKVTYDDGERRPWIHMALASTITYNQNSMVFYHDRRNRTEAELNTVTAFKLNYNIESFNPKIYDRVRATPIWNNHAICSFRYGSLVGYVQGDYFENPYIDYNRAEVYGVTKSSFNGDILTASMGYSQSPCQRVRAFTKYWRFNETVKDIQMRLDLPVLFSNAVKVPAPVDANIMIGAIPYYNLPDNWHVVIDITNCSDIGKVMYGAVSISPKGLIGNYTADYNNTESMILTTSTGCDIQDISSNLWDSFDENGNISIIMELTSLDANQAVNYSSKCVHLLGLTGYIEYKVSDLYVRVKGECEATVPDAFDLLLTTYNGINYVGGTNLAFYRGEWNIGRQVNEQNNSLDYINELCQQSWVVGWTNRSGNIELRAIDDRSVHYTHDDNIILRDSIKNFNITPLTKVCNELSIEADYNDITGKYDKIYSVDNIEQDTFPDADQGVGNTIQLGSDPNFDSYTSIQCKVGTYPDYMIYAITTADYNGKLAVGDTIRINPFKVLVYDTDNNTNLLASYYYDGNTSTSDQPPFGGVIKGTEGQSHMIVDEIILDDPTPGWTYFKCLKTSVTGVLADILIAYPNRKFVVASYLSEITKVDQSSMNAEWRSWVQGIDSYADAKDIWNTCKNAWYENKTINKYPDSLSKLSWFNNRNSFEDVTTYDETDESAYMFFKKAITWCTRQKYKVVYQIPLTSDTIKVDLMDTIDFHDPILTGFYNGDRSYLNGYVTSLSCKPSQKVIEIELTAEMVYTTPAPMPMTGDIIELSTNTDDIIELSTNTDNIIER